MRVTASEMCYCITPLGFQPTCPFVFLLYRGGTFALFALVARAEDEQEALVHRPRDG